MYAITKARPFDVRSLAAIERAAAELLRGHAPQSVIEETTDDSTFRCAQVEGRLWVVLDGQEPVGFALVEMLTDDAPHLDEIDVHPAHGRRGLGAALVRAVCEWATRCGFAEVTLTTFKDVPWNLPFYSRLGFEVVPPSELRAELRDVVIEEASRGLDAETRVVMRYRCAARKERSMLTGGCLCGAVRYEIDGKIGPVANCHCRTCRKAQGGAFASNAPVRAKYFRLLSGADRVAEYESSPGKKRSFCRVCGSPLWSRRESEPETIRIRLGLLDSDPGRRPLAHVWIAEKAPWYEIADDLPRSPGGGEELARSSS